MRFLFWLVLHLLFLQFRGNCGSGDKTLFFGRYKMKALPATKYQSPKYPSKKQVQEQPQLLKRCVSSRWQKLFDAGLSGAMLAGISLAGCQNDSAQNPAPIGGSQIGSIQNPSQSTATTSKQTNKLAALVAPVFEHGEGRGTSGCLVAAPPVFLSEEEAFVVIKEELAKHGIELDKEKVIINDINLTPVTVKDADEMSIEKDQQQPLEIYLKNSSKEINIAFVSQDDYFQLGGKKSISSVQGYNIKNIALQVRNQIQNDAKQGTYGIFYDPMSIFKFYELREYENIPNISSEERFKLMLKKAVEPSKELLRQQVQDFADWLKEQKAI